MANLKKKNKKKQQAHDWMQRAAALHSQAASSSSRRSDCLLNGNTNYGNRLWRTEWTIKSAGRSTYSRGLQHIWQLLSPFGGRGGEEGGGRGGGEEGEEEEEEEEEEERHWSSAGKIWFPANNRLPVRGGERNSSALSVSWNKNMATHCEREDRREECAFIVSGELREDAV